MRRCFPNLFLLLAMAPLLFSHFLEETDAITFSCDQLNWEKDSQRLLLKGNAQFKSEGIGSIESEETVEIQQEPSEKDWAISSIVAKGKTRFVYHGDLEHILIADAGMRLDGKSLTLSASRSEESPLIYRSNGLTVEADHAKLEYLKRKDKLVAKKLSLSGGIHMIGGEEEERLALADHFTYIPEKRQAILSATKGREVLFWDKEKDLSISAKAVHILQGQQGEQVKGIGKVRLAFSTAEKALLQALFPSHPATEDPSYE